MRRAAVTLELILTMPIILIILTAMIQMSVMGSSQQHLQLSAFAAAQQASKMPLPSRGDVPKSIISAAQTVLDARKISVDRLIVEHNVGVSADSKLVFQTDGKTLSADEAAAVASFSEGPLRLNSGYVRVTVQVQTKQLAPNLLAVFGFDLSNRISSKSVLMPHLLELPPIGAPTERTPAMRTAKTDESLSPNDAAEVRR